jgi:prepilin-type N-terminal cleavage/methylation domain-containing protein
MYDEEGFTLIELLIGMVIVGILIGAIGSALVVSLRTTDVTSKRMSQNHDVQITSSYLANDVQSAAIVSVPSLSDNCSGAATTLVDLTYYSAGSPIARYACRTAGGETQVTRSFQGATSILAHFAGTARPTVTCTPSCSATPLDTVTILFTKASDCTLDCTYTLVGSRRAYSQSGGGGTGTTIGDTTFYAMGAGGSSPIWIAGGCSPGQITNGTCINDPDTPNDPTANPSLTIKGNLYVNSTLANAVKLTGKKNATKLTICSTTPSPCAANGTDGKFMILSPGGCAGCNGNVVTCPVCPSSNPMWSGYSPTFPDPLRSLPAPDPATLGTGSCAGAVCQPGVYNSTLSRTSNTTLNSGIYYLTQGISITGNSSLTSNGQVLLYIAGGSVNLAGGSTVNLTPPSSGTYKNIVIFQARTDFNDVKVTGGSSPIAFNGVIYVPNSNQVTLATGGAQLTAKAIVAQNIKISSNAQVIIG